MSQLPKLKLNNDIGFVESANPLKTVSTMAYSTAKKDNI